MGLPPRQETIKDGLKTVIEYRFNDDDRRVKVVTKYNIVTKKVPKAVALRKVSLLLLNTEQTADQSDFLLEMEEIRSSI